jgi:hypothetical protein
LLSLAAVIPLSGWTTERFGVKRIWIASIALFARQLMGHPELFGLKPHRSGGDQKAALGLDQALVAVRSVAVADVVCHRLRGRPSRGSRRS